MSNRRLVFFGNERLATGIEETTAPALRGLISAGYDIAAVVISQRPARSRKIRPLEVQEIAEEHSIPVMAPQRPIDIIDDLRSLEAQAGVLAAYGRIVPQALIDIFPRGIINIHPSLLPLYRGPIPIEQAILDGAAQTGVSIMSLISNMDAGPVYARKTHPLSGSETKADLAAELGREGAGLLIEALPAILAGTLPPEPQDEAKASYCSLLTKESGIIDWGKPAEQLEREVRAFLGWPGSRTQVLGREILVTAAQAEPDTPLAPGEVSARGRRLVVGTGKGSLRIQRLKPSGKREMDAADFLAGAQIQKP